MSAAFSFASRRARRLAARLALLALGTLAGAAHAAAIAGPGGTAEQGRRQVADSPALTPDAPALISARIDAVDTDGRHITLSGKSVPLHGQQLRVLGPGGAALSGVQALRAGMQVRFGLEPEARVGNPAPLGAPPERRIVLIYVDSQP